MISMQARNIPSRINAGPTGDEVISCAGDGKNDWSSAASRAQVGATRRRRRSVVILRGLKWAL